MSPKNKLVNRLHHLQPHLLRDEIAQKIAATREESGTSMRSFLFYRAFVPYFYHLLRQPKYRKGLHGAAAFTGRCVGDPHLENFGFMRPKPGGRLRFTMNDPDDGGQGAPVFDLLRLLVGIRLYDKQFDLDHLFTPYCRGVRGQNTRTHASRRLVKKALKKSHKKHPAGELYTRCKPVRLTTADDDLDYGAPTPRTVLQISQSIHAHFGGSHAVDDIIAFKKRGGGSGGLPQFRALLRRQKGNKKSPLGDYAVLDVKPLLRSGLYPRQCDDRSSLSGLCSLDPETIVRRVKKTLQWERGKHASACLPTIIPGIGPVLLRLRQPGELGVSLKRIRDEKVSLRKLSKLEAAELGKLHRDSMQNHHRTEYIAKIRNKKEKIIKQAKRLAKRLRSDYTKL
ncbi:MAG: DUF2252 family protein [Magnetococcus sp. YQC-3]